jgi:colanic acid biosynthesis glycosyl transferase WcaI
MRILIHGINFSPELTGIGKYSGEMAEWLAVYGHEVRVVTVPPYYPQWRVADGYANRCREVVNLPQLPL